MTQSQTLTRIGWIVRDLRLALGWTQRDLAFRAGVSQALVSAIERGRLANVSIAAVTRLIEAMGGALVIDATRPFLGDRERQRDPAHVRCTNQVIRRLREAGWRTATEVEVGGNRSRGWIDVFAWHPKTGLVIVVEIKTEIHDLGAIERTLGWYEREAWAAARRLGWHPARIVGALIVLSTEANEDRLRDNREAFARGFPIRASDLALIVSGAHGATDGGRAMAMIDPRSKRRTWLRPSRIDGRRSAAPYENYADFMHRLKPTRRSAA
jgi:transcriptional regulator with XRE-family HTH domain